MRVAINDAMDIHAGKAVIDGPHNYLGNIYRSIPVGITVEGANILTRNLIVFGQGAIRCHPYLLEEMTALTDPDPAKGLARFDKAFWKHVWATASRPCCGPGGAAGPAALFVAGAQSAGAATRLLPPSEPLRQRLRVPVGDRPAHPGRRPQAQGDDLRAPGRHPGRSLLTCFPAALKRWHDEGRQQDDPAAAAVLHRRPASMTIEARLRPGARQSAQIGPFCRGHRAAVHSLPLRPAPAQRALTTM